MSQWTSTDGPEARALTLSLFGMKPWDTDADYFDGYTTEQLEWARSNGEYLSMLATEREERAARRKAS